MQRLNNFYCQWVVWARAYHRRECNHHRNCLHTLPLVLPPPPPPPPPADSIDPEQMPAVLLEDDVSFSATSEDSAQRNNGSNGSKAAAPKKFHAPKAPTRVPTIALTPKTMVLLEWRGLSCSVAAQRGRKQILHVSSQQFVASTCR